MPSLRLSIRRPAVKVAARHQIHRRLEACGIERERCCSAREKLIARVAGELAGEPVRGEIPALFVENDCPHGPMLERFSEESLLDQVLLEWGELGNRHRYAERWHAGQSISIGRPAYLLPVGLTFSSSARNRKKKIAKTAKKTIACSIAIVTPASCWSACAPSPQSPPPST